MKVVAASVLVLAILLIAALGPAQAATSRVIAGNTAPGLATATYLGRADPDAPMTVTLWLDLRDRAGLEQLIADQQTPGSPSYHRWLTHEEFVARYSPSAPDLALASDFLGSRGFTNVHQASSRSVSGDAPVSTVESALSVRMNNYLATTLEGPKPALANDRDPTLPLPLASKVVAVGGIDLFTQAFPKYKVGTTNYQLPRDTQVTQEQKALYFDQGSKGIPGATIAIPSNGDVLLTDLNSVLSAEGGNAGGYTNFTAATSGAHTLHSTCVPSTGSGTGCTFQTSTSSGSLETGWDVQSSGSIAIDSHIEVYLSQTTAITSFDVMYQAVVDASNVAKVVTHSWGSCLASTSTSVFNNDNTMFAQAVATGQAWFIATGDTGSSCNGQTTTDWPGSSVYVTGAGGTNMANANWGADGWRTGYTSETGCSSSGGGIANTGPTVARPSWQSGWGIAAGSFRLVPDISLHYGQCSSGGTQGYFMYHNSQALGGISGTSGDAPQMAGFWAVGNQVVGQNLGHAAPYFYKILRNESGTSYASSFHDVSGGATNGQYTAAAGHDMVTGVGSPRFSSFYDDLKKFFATPPTTSISLSGTLGNAGWYTSSVSVTLACAPAAPATCASTSYKVDGGPTQAYGGAFTVSGDAAHTLQYWSTGNDSAVETTKTQAINIDGAAPSLALQSRTPANGAGWNNANVVVVWTCTDAVSGAASATVTRTLSTEGASQSATGTCADVAGNSASSTQSGISIDKTAPAIAGGRTPAANAAGWSNTDVTASWTCTDALSGVASAPADVVFTNELAGQSAGGTCIDVAGNGASSTVGGISIDKSAPSLLAAHAPPANGFGWNNGDVTLSWTCSDALSGATGAPAPVTFTQEGVNQQTSVTCADAAGNVASDTQYVSIDKTAPTVGATKSPSANANGWNKANTTLTWSCADALSGAQGAAPPPVTFTSEGAAQSASASCLDNAGNSATGSASVSIDQTAPSIAFASRSPAPNAAGWNNANVLVTWSCSDALSGATATSASQTVSSQGSALSSTGTCTDLAGNAASDTRTGIKIDKTNPLIAFSSRLPAANGAGWNNADVTVTWNCTDALSGPAAPTASVTVATEGASQGAVGTCADVAGNVASNTRTGISIDKTPPALNGARTPAANADGWVNGNVAVSWTCSDALSGLSSVPTNVTVTTEGANQARNATCNDRAGNVASATVAGISIDKTAPSLAGTKSPAANAAGWNNADVTVSWTCTDALSGVKTSPADATVSSEGAGQSRTGTCTDKAGNAASNTQSNIHVDKTPPTTTPSASGTLGQNGWHVSSVTLTLARSDSLSGVASSSYALNGGAAQTYGAPVTLAAQGTTVASAWSTDLAGNVGAPSGLTVRIDTVAPTLAPHADVTTPATSPSGATVAYGAPAASDATSGAGAVACAPASGALFPIGNTTVGCGVADAAGNAASSSFVVHVLPGSVPTIAPHADVVAEATSAAGAVVTYTAPTAHDQEDGDVPVTCAPASGASFALGATSVTCNATDSGGHAAVPTSFLVTVRDTTPPLVADASDVVAEASGASGATVTFPAPATSDLVDGAGVAACAPASGGAFALGDTTVTCAATDAAGNAATPRSFLVHVVDTTAPSIDAAADVVAEATGASGSVVAYAAPATHDAVDGAGVATCAPASGSAFALGATTVTCGASDAHGNTASGTSFLVTVRDTTAPLVDDVADVVAEATGASGAPVAYAPPATSDAVDGAGHATCAPASGSAFALGATSVACSATDASGNSAATSFTVTVVDTTAPLLEGVADVVAEATGASGATVAYAPPATSDAVDGAGVASCAPASGATFALGATTVVCSATDAHGNAADAATFVVTVRDTTAPSIAPHADLRIASTSPTGAVASFDAPATSDAVDGAGAATCAPASGSLFAVGDTIVVCDATDAAGNAATPTSFVVHVTFAPVATIATSQATYGAVDALQGAVQGTFHLANAEGAPIAGVAVQVRVLRQLPLVGFTDHVEFVGTTDANGDLAFAPGLLFSLPGGYMAYGVVTTPGIDAMASTHYDVGAL
ncbi:MAG TPA: HYR domain-containing protein [Candidatus Thermoplasmatota archaeon]|nr:HYR domain-containing protein [Candidatus Thermoplasmatota archaeon]